ncbi:fibronectin type III domain-containing protein [Parabacteroides sp. FAFU027]|uniref:fibronectin type III domain-containing protein n=1 Tax=Parabacteroides sp. FAFU027 TaxID=2922715 RepID=UPI001FB02560|nr:fibronectin type III domain-containing protein [Parabacteroides sp. FAFU027]
MKKDRLVLDFKKLSVPEKISFGRNVHQSMTGNTHFATPDILLETLKQSTDTLEQRFVNAQNGGKEETMLLRQAEEYWDDLHTKEGRYVERIADGDGAIILSAGYNLAKPQGPGQKAEFSVVLGSVSGSVLLRRQAYTGANSYIWQICEGTLPEDESGWTTIKVTSRASVEVTGLKPLTRYWFRVAVVTPQGTTAFSSPIMQGVV